MLGNAAGAGIPPMAVRYTQNVMNMQASGMPVPQTMYATMITDLARCGSKGSSDSATTAPLAATTMDDTTGRSQIAETVLGVCSCRVNLNH